MIRILVEPKNAIVKQYQKLFEMDHIQLTFDAEALKAIAHLAIERKNGARGLRSIMESILSEAMFAAPSDGTIETLTITADCVKGKEGPRVTYDLDRPTTSLTLPATKKPRPRQRFRFLAKRKKLTPPSFSKKKGGLAFYEILV